MQRQQSRTARGLRSAKSWEVVERYVDDDVSAWSGKRRPEYTRCLDDLEAGVIDGLLVYDLDLCTDNHASWRRSSTCAIGCG